MTNNPSDALHAALREACESAAKKLFPDGFDTEFRKIIEKELTPVVEALVGAAYKACAEHMPWSDGKCACGQRWRPLDYKEHQGNEGYITYATRFWAEHISSITPESAARALREHEDALIEAAIDAGMSYETSLATDCGDYPIPRPTPDSIRASLSTRRRGEVDEPREHWQ